MIKSRMMRWARHVAFMGRREMHTRCCWGILKELDHFKYQDVDMKIILNVYLKRLDGRTDIIHQAQNSEKWRSAASTVMNLQTPYKTRRLLDS
jgi:chaperone required for assembly of F1-ATPase